TFETARLLLEFFTLTRACVRVRVRKCAGRRTSCDTANAGPHRRTGARRGSAPARRLVVLGVADVRAPGGALTEGTGSTFRKYYSSARSSCRGLRPPGRG